MTASSICYAPACGHCEPGSVPRCPRCGAKMRTPTFVRSMGMVMLLCGMVLVGMMGTITYYLAPLLNDPGVESAGGTRFDGSADEARMILQLFWVVIGFGVAAIAAGLWQMVTARRDRWVTISVLVLASFVIVAARFSEAALS